MEPVTLPQLLAARDARAQRQQELLLRGKPLLCFTMNIAGPVKTSPLIEQGFRLGLRRLQGQLLRLKCPVLHREVRFLPTGPEAYFVLDAPADRIKAMTVDLEEADELGRLLDLDVIDPVLGKLERQQERSCLICGAPGRGCARSRAHTVEQLQAKTTAILAETLNIFQRNQVAELACRALLFEACTTPKPGLVDRENNGSHRDMDLFSFMASAAALMPYFETCTAIGQETAHLPPEETFRQLRRPGRMAEGSMHLATGGVNTHKGAVFLLGVLCGVLGRFSTSLVPVSHRVLAECAAMTRGITAKELQNSPKITAGERFFADFSIGGIRWEVENGLPTVKNHGLPTLEAALKNGCTLEEAGCHALLAMMAAAEDTALLHRGGTEGWQWVKTRAAEILQSGVTGHALRELDQEMIRRNLSPGGSADLLAVCYFFHFLKEEVLKSPQPKQGVDDSNFLF